MNYKTISAKKRKFIELINKNELVGEHIIYFMKEDRINVNRY